MQGMSTTSDLDGLLASVKVEYVRLYGDPLHAAAAQDRAKEISEELLRSRIEPLSDETITRIFAKLGKPTLTGYQFRRMPFCRNFLITRIVSDVQPAGGSVGPTVAGPNVVAAKAAETPTQPPSAPTGRTQYLALLFTLPPAKEVSYPCSTSVLLNHKLNRLAGGCGRSVI